MFEARHAGALEGIPEELCIVRHFTFTIGGGDQQDIIHLGKIFSLDFVERRDLGIDAIGLHQRAEILGQPFGVARLGAVKNVGRQRSGRGRRRGLQPLHHLGVQTGIEPRQPGLLIIREGRIFG